MKKFAFLISALIFTIWVSGISHAQSTVDNKAKAYFFAAQDAFDAKNYDAAISDLQNVQDLLGQSNVRIEALRAKAYYHKGSYSEAKLALENFFTYEAPGSLMREMAPYTRDIDAKFEAEKIRLENLRLANAEKARQATLLKDAEALKSAAITREANSYIETAPKKCSDSKNCYSRAVNLSKRAESNIKDYFDLWSEIRVLSHKACTDRVQNGCTLYGQSLYHSKLHWSNYKKRLPLIYEMNKILTGKHCQTATCLRTQALALQEKDCFAGSLNGCAWALRTLPGQASTHRKRDALEMKACSLGDGLYCGAVADVARSSSSPYFNAKSIKYYKLACEKKNASSCLILADNIRMGRWMRLKPNKKLARTYYQRYCDLINGSDRICQRSKHFKWKKK